VRFAERKSKDAVLAHGPHPSTAQQDSTLAPLTLRVLPCEQVASYDLFRRQNENMKEQASKSRVYISNPRIRQDLPSQLLLQLPGSRLAVLGLMIACIILSLGFIYIALSLKEVGVAVLVTFLVGGGSFALALFATIEAQLVINADARSITLTRRYLLGLGPFLRLREKQWSFERFTRVHYQKIWGNNQIELEVDNKIQLVLNFGVNSTDASLASQKLASWLENEQSQLGGPTTEPGKVLTIEQHKQLVKNVSQMLFLLGGGNILFWTLVSPVGLSTLRSIIGIVTGFSYIAFGFGAQRKSKLAVSLAIPIYAIERIYSLTSNAAVKGWGWASCVSGSFALFAIMALWYGIKSMRAIEQEEKRQGMPLPSQRQDNMNGNAE
jgi:hypothetical protein